MCVVGRQKFLKSRGWQKQNSLTHTAGLSASGVSYLICDCNSFPKKIKVT